MCPEYWPSIGTRDLTETSGKIDATSSENGKVYVAVLVAGATAPTAAQVKAQSVGVVKGEITATANTQGTLPLTGLSGGTDYKAYLVGEDAASNLQTAVTAQAFSTPDLTKPILSAIGTRDLAESTGKLDATSSEGGKIYVVVLVASAAAPTAAQVKAQSVGVSKGVVIVAGGVSGTLSMSGLSGSTEYNAYLLAEDVALNAQTSPTAHAFTTLDLTPMTLRDVSTRDLVETGGKLDVTSNENAQIKAQSVGLAKGIVTTTADVRATLQMTGLSAKTQYIAWLEGEDAAGNGEPGITTAKAFTTPDLTPPTLSGLQYDSSTVRAQTPDTESINVYSDKTETTIKHVQAMNELGKAYWAIVTGSASLTSSAVKAFATSSCTGTCRDAGVKTNVGGLSSPDFEYVAAGLGTLSMTGLTSSTDYKAYLVAEDAAGNTQTSVTAEAFSTRDLTHPALSQMGDRDLTETSAKVYVTSNEACVIYWL
eukprot:g6216.t1